MSFLRATLLAATLSLMLSGAGCDRGSHPDNIGRPAPEFVIADEFHSVDLAKLRGKVVLVNLWASWCAPCVDELPSLLALQHEMPGVTVIAISMDQDDAAYRSFLKRNNVDLLTVRDPDGRVNALYGTVQIPETYAIDRNGILQRKFVSAQNWTSPEIMDYLHRIGA
jgi:cytochrome c biogenesis protein CcmG, thiol:disulfide interchange protein DsbE